jgi:Domain of unknown function (DUF5615)
MAGRFAYLADENVGGPLLKALEERGYPVVRATRLFGEKTADAELLAYAARQGYILVSTDADMLEHADAWLESGRRMHGLVFWEQQLQKRVTVGAFLRAFDELETSEGPFAQPIVFLRPQP